MNQKNNGWKRSLAVVVSLWTGNLWAAAPANIHYQGKLTDSSGKPVSNGNYELSFKICADNPGFGPCATLWSDTLPTVPVSAGVFGVSLTGFDPAVFQGGVDRWLEVVYEGSPFLPRQKLVAAPYALAVAEGSVGSLEIKDSSVDSLKILDGSLQNADVSATAAIEASKIDFSQGVAIDTPLGGGEKLAVNGNLRVEGDVQFNKTLTVGSGGIPLQKVISVSGTLEGSPNVPANGTLDKTLSVPGARPGDALMVGLPAGLDNDLMVMGLIKENDEVTFRFLNTSSPAKDSCDSCEFRVVIVQVE